jgi:Tfp pilus assembly protein PilZ
VSGALDVYCEVDGRSVPIEPTDLSAAGLFVHTPAPAALDSEVSVLLRIGGSQFEASGHVVQSVSLEAAKKDQRRPGFGILFTHLEDDVRARLRDTIDTALAERTERLRNLNTSTDLRELRPKAPPPIDPKERELLERLRAELAALQSQPPWTVLGISQGSDAATAHQAFLAASKRYHPHVYARYALPEIKDTVTQLFIACKRAYTTLTKTSRAHKNAPGRSSDPGNR